MLKKNCAKCGIVKPSSCFHKQPRNESGLQSYCKECNLSSVALYKLTKAGVIQTIFDSQIRSSKTRGHRCPNYTRSELAELINKQGNFDSLYLNWVNSGYSAAKKPSVDRKNDSKEYTLGNLLRVCTWGENRNRYYEDKKNGINNKNSKAVIQMSLNGRFIAEYHSIMHAGMVTGCNNANINSCCTGKRRVAGGFRWMHSLNVPIANNQRSAI